MGEKSAVSSDEVGRRSKTWRRGGPWPMSSGLLGLAGLLLGTPFAARAEEPTQGAAALDYQAPATCPDASAFERALRSRGVNLGRSTGHGRIERLTVTLEPDGSGVVGKLSVLASDGAVTERRVEARSCAEAHEGLALITALVLSPEANGEVASNEADGPAEPMKAPRATEESEPEPKGDARKAARHLPTWFLEVRAGASAETGVAPEALFGAAGSLTLGRSVSRWLAPALRLGASGTVSRTFSPPASDTSGSASFRTLLGHVDACWLDVAIGQAPLAVRSCLVTELGVIGAEGSGTDLDESHDAFLAASGASLELDFLLGRTWRLGVGASGLVPYARDEFVLAGETIFEVAPVLGRFWLDVALRTTLPDRSTRSTDQSTRSAK